MQLRFSIAGLVDAELVHEITQAAFDEYRGVLMPPSSVYAETPADLVRAWSTGAAGAAIAWVGNEAVGAGRYEVRPEHLYIGRVAVLPAYRGQGIGSALMRFIEGLAPGHNRWRVRLGVRRSLPRNLKLYERLGYSVVGVQPHPHGFDEVIWLEKHISSGAAAPIRPDL